MFLRFVFLVGALGFAGCQAADQSADLSASAPLTSPCKIDGKSYSAEECHDFRRIKTCIEKSCGSRLSEQCVQDADGNQDKGIVGGGWGGNWMGYAKCTETHNGAQQLIEKCLRTKPALKTKHIRACSILRHTPQHIYYGICNDKQVMAWADPWRYGHCNLFQPSFVQNQKWWTSTTPWTYVPPIDEAELMGEDGP